MGEDGANVVEPLGVGEFAGLRGVVAVGGEVAHDAVEEDPVGVGILGAPAGGDDFDSFQGALYFVVADRAVVADVTAGDSPAVAWRFDTGRVRMPHSQLQAS